MNIPEPWLGTLQATLRLIDQLEAEIGNCERELPPGRSARLHPQPHDRSRHWLGPRDTIASEIGDISRFATPKKLCGYTGLCPRVYQSGGTDRRGALAKNGPNVRSSTRWWLEPRQGHQSGPIAERLSCTAAVRHQLRRYANDPLAGAKQITLQTAREKWDQGTEMAPYAQLRLETGLRVFFCDPQSPWQRGTNENTNGLLRQYFPKGTDLSAHTANDLAAVAAAPNSRPRKTLGWRTPAEVLNDHRLSCEKITVATIP